MVRVATNPTALSSGFVAAVLELRHLVIYTPSSARPLRLAILPARDGLALGECAVIWLYA